ncbi:MAG: hypothetical protein ACP5FH_00435 [Terracidiphilus sp.]
MLFSDFLKALFAALREQGVRFCILRNYEEFPARNVGGDVDFLIDRSQLAAALRAVHSISGIRIVGLTERAYVTGVFLAGASSTAGSRCLQLDFIWILSWKQMPFLPAEAVLQSAVPREAGELNFLVPLPAHEAITSLLMGLLYGGRAKEKYLSKVRQSFAACREEIIAALRPQFGLKATTRLMEAVTGGDLGKIDACAGPLRFSLCWRCLLRRPLGSVRGVLWYYKREIAVRLLPKNVDTICILDPDGGAQAEVIDELMPRLRYAAKVVHRRHFSLRPPLPPEPTGSTPSQPVPAGSFASVKAVAGWMVQEWRDHFVKRTDTLRIFDNDFHGLLIEPQRYGYSGPLWFARLAGRMLPPPSLWILLQPEGTNPQPGNPAAAASANGERIEAYRKFVATRKNHVILDAGMPPAVLAEESFSAIVNRLEQRVDKRLRRSL